jgi:hypothetical protein
VLAVVLADEVDLNDVGMRESRCRTRLADEAREKLRLLREVLAEDLMAT